MNFPVFSTDKSFRMRICPFVAGIALLLIGPGSAGLAQTMGDLKMCQNMQADPDQIIRACTPFIATRRAVGGRPAPANALSSVAALRGMAHARKYEYELALPDYNLGLALNPKNTAIYGLRALAYWQNADPKRAMIDIEEAIRTTKGAGLSENYSNRASFYLAGLDYDRAAADLDMAIRVNPKNPLAFLSRGQLNAFRGNEEASAADYKTAVKLNPKLQEKIDSLGEVTASWIAYLKDIQNAGETANWSRPPLEAFRMPKP
jgi:tetratricopeptide (TPR) repeat protein